MHRRAFLAGATALVGTGLMIGRPTLASATTFEVTHSDSEWRSMLTSLEYKVMRKQGTERAGSSPLDKVYDKGTYHCRGCDLPLYSSKTKFDSGTGWPSFWKAKKNAIGTQPDRTIWGVHTECHCRRCGSHLGHIFDDGPKPTGKRHCINGVSLVFKPA
ncbi:Peptide methionine sulfoxide reductase MsrB [Shimia thalassica]|uniref:peptide-methionine (R)-S-oxide reductase n=1 Tax=Shimia thalassica TaxID=1715693 RepID=A0A0P1I4W6_9RHOB|nr:peptide-methionine (R)-S-oxide reductase MsrB [Shimia thalassica]CUJ89834.1 Peptide methionine sulfoxide reductase MsrB [Shimia thalassica]